MAYASGGPLLRQWARACACRCVRRRTLLAFIVSISVVFTLLSGYDPRGSFLPPGTHAGDRREKGPYTPLEPDVLLGEPDNRDGMAVHDIAYPPPLAVAGGDDGAASRFTTAALGMATGTDEAHMLAFALSLAKHTDDTRIFLFVSRSPRMEAAFPSQVTFIVVGARGDIDVDGRPVPAPWSQFHPSNARYYFYSHWLKLEGARGRLYDAVLVSDVRDVFFQSDPFEIVEDNSLHVFREPARVTLGNGGGVGNHANRDWLAQCYGAEVADRYADRPVVCSGFTVGSGAAVERYLDLVTAELSARATCERNGVDQGVHNYLVHSGVLARSVSLVEHANENGPVLTMGFLSAEEIPEEVDEPIENERGEVYAVLHQYDRHPRVLDALRRRVGLPAKLSAP